LKKYRLLRLGKRISFADRFPDSNLPRTQSKLPF